MKDRFRYLNTGLGVIMGFVGVKMLVTHWYHLPIWLSLVVITAVLGISVAASLRAERHESAG
jgi:tellurite resistance protein TerC